jgi:uncharacterized membrane protein
MVIGALAVDLVVVALLVAIALRHRTALRAGWMELRRVDVPRRDAIGLAILTIGATLLRAPLLRRPMGTDEAASFLYYASKPLVVGLTIYGSPNNHLLHTALMHAAWRLFGTHEWALRLPAFAFGIALVPLTYFAARSLVGEGGLMASAFVAAAPIFVDYSTDGRGYTMLCAFTLAALLAMLRVVRTQNPVATGLFAIHVALGAFAVPAMIYPFAMFVAWRPRKMFAGAILAGVATLILYLPVLAVSGVAAITANPYVRPLPFDRFIAEFPRAVAAMWTSWMTAIPVILQIVIGIAFVAGVVRARVTLWLGAIAVLALLALQRVIPFTRVWLPFAILFVITASAALPWRRWEPLAAAVLFAVLAIAACTVPRLRETGELPHVREIARDLATRAAVTDAVVAAPPSDVPLAFYLDARVLRPDLIRARRLFIVTNRAYGTSLDDTLRVLRIDSRHFAIHQVRELGESAIYELDRL